MNVEEPVARPLLDSSAHPLLACIDETLPVLHLAPAVEGIANVQVRYLIDQPLPFISLGVINALAAERLRLIPATIVQLRIEYRVAPSRRTPMLKGTPAAAHLVPRYSVLVNDSAT